MTRPKPESQCCRKHTSDDVEISSGISHLDRDHALGIELVQDPFEGHAKDLIADQAGQRNSSDYSGTKGRKGQDSSAERDQADENERRCRERRVPVEGSPARENRGYHQPEYEDNREDAESSPVQMPSALNHRQHCINKDRGHAQRDGDEQGFGSSRRAGHVVIGTIRCMTRWLSRTPHCVRVRAITSGSPQPSSVPWREGCRRILPVAEASPLRRTTAGTRRTEPDAVQLKGPGDLRQNHPRGSTAPT